MGDVDVSYGEILIIDTYDTNAANIELANIAQSVSAYATGSPGSLLYSPLTGISAETFYFSNNVFVTNDLTISGSIFFNSLVVSGDSVFKSNLNIVKDCSINSNLYVDKVTTLEEQVNINGPLSTGGAVYFQGAHTHTIEDSIEVGNIPGAAPGVAIGPTPRADSQILLDSSYGNIFATGYLQVNETTSIGKLGSLVNDCRIAHIDHSTDNYAFQQSLLGITSINAVDGRYITFDISQNEKIRIDSSGNTHFNSSDPSYVAIDISATSGIKLPKGTTSERPEGNPDISGIIRYNTETQQFEGYATAWQGLGGVIDVNQDTKIMAEDYPTADNNELRFYTKNIERMKVDASGTIQMMIYDDSYIALDISATTGIMLPKGNTAQRPVAGGRDTSIREDISGVIRYNTETQQFEGYATAWQGLGGVIDVDQDTKITAEDNPNDDNDELKFFTAGTPRMIIKSDGKVDISENVHLDKRLDVSGATVLDSTLNVTGDAVFGGQIHGPSTFYIDPSPINDDSGTVVVRGNLQVDGTTTTINSTTVDISDLTIKLAANSNNAASSNGAGIEVQYGGSILYKDPDNVWEFNRGVSITSGTLEVTNSIDCGSSGTFADTLICSKDGTGLSVSKDATIGGTLTLLTLTGATLDNCRLGHDDYLYFETSGNTNGAYIRAYNAWDQPLVHNMRLQSCRLGHNDYLYFETNGNTNGAYIRAYNTWDQPVINNMRFENCYMWAAGDVGNYLYFGVETSSGGTEGAYIRTHTTWDQPQLYNFKLSSCKSDGDFVVDGDIDCNGDIECNGLTLPGGDVQTQIDGKQDALTFGIQNTNVIKCGSGIADNDFLRVNGTTLEGRSASELLSDIGAQATLTTSSRLNANCIGGGNVSDTEFNYLSGVTSDIQTQLNNSSSPTTSGGTNFTSGVAKIGTVPNNNAVFSHSSYFSLSDYGFLQTPLGVAIMNAPEDQCLYFRIGNDSKMRMTSDGYLGIGTTNPDAPLDVYTDPADWKTMTVKLYVDEAQTAQKWDLHNGSMTSSNGGEKVSARFNGAITIKGAYHESDERIKKDIVDISDDQALITLRKLKPKIYKYKSLINDASENVYGFIAQEVEEVLPYSVKKQKAYIPNIMDVAKVSDIQYETETESGSCILTFDTDITDISLNDYICCCDSSLNEITDIEIIEIIDSKTIKINKAFTTTETTFQNDAGGLTTNSIIVKGKLVDDFHILEKNRIWTVATAALQEVDRQLQAEKSKVETLENQVLTLNSELAAIKTHLGL